MSYVYSCKEEEEYYTKWRKDLETNACKEVVKKIARNLASMGMDTKQIAIAAGLSAEDVLAALQTDGKL